MSTVLKLVYYKSKVANFGDDLNDPLWRGLAPGLFTEQSAQGFLGIGTILGIPVAEVEQLHVFSSGAGYLPVDTVSVDHRFWCVRGPLTAKCLGLDASISLTDGAILAPALFKPPVGAAGGVGVVPHWESLGHQAWDAACREAGFDLIDPMREPGEVIADIASKSLILTESLHGAIIADTYGVPWIAFLTSGNFSVFKWMDWSLSVGVPLDVSVVPPPTADSLIRFGRPNLGSWGHRAAPSLQDAQDEYARRTVAGSPPGFVQALKGRIKSKLKATPLARRMLDCSSERTAEALVGLAALSPQLSSPRTRGQRTEEMARRLAELAKEQGAGQVEIAL